MPERSLIPPSNNWGGLGKDDRRWKEGHFGNTLKKGGQNVVTVDQLAAYATVASLSGYVTTSLYATDQSALNAAVSARILSTEKGAANGVATLGPGGTLTTSQIPAALLGALNFQSNWNANTNSPAIPTAASGNKGWFYLVTTAGATNLDGETDWKIGDWAVSTGTAWIKVDNTDKVVSVAGKTGVVTLVIGDIASLEGELAALTSGLAAEEDYIDFVSARVDGHDTELAALDSRLDPLEANVGWIERNSSSTAEAGQKILADNSTTAWDLSLPPTPSIGDEVKVAPKTTWLTHNLTILGNGHNIEASATLVCDEDKLLTLIYNGTIWKVFISV